MSGRRGIIAKPILHVLMLCLLLLPFQASSAASVAASVAASLAARAAEQPATLEVFVREGCPHCAQAKDYLPEFAAEHPELQLVYRQIDRDADARADLERHSRNAGVWPPGVPTFVFEERVLVGFESPQRSGPMLAALVGPAPAAAGELQTRLFGTLSVSRVGLPLFTLALGLLDGFNPCAMWVLLFLLSMLVHLHDRRRMAAIAGCFVLVGGAVYYAFMAAWLNVFLVLGMSTALRLMLGAAALAIGFVNVRDFYRPAQQPTLSIPASAKPGIYARVRNIVRTDTLWVALGAAAALAVVVNFIELLCTAGLPAMYTAVLTQQNLTASAHYAYLALYILGYIADDTLMLAVAVTTLSSRKLTESTGRWLKLLSGAVMLVLGLILVLRPQWLM